MGAILESTLVGPARTGRRRPAPAPARARRAAPRHPRYQRTAGLIPAVILDGARETACQVINISASGALIRVPAGEVPETIFTIRIEHHQPFQAEVVRRGHDDQWGIAFFDCPRQVQDIVDQILGDQDANCDQRLFPRRLVMLAGSFYLGDQFVHCRIRNLSVGGVLLEAPVHLGPGHRIGLRTERFGTMPAYVVWFSRRGLGAAFFDDSAAILDRIGHLLPPPPRASL